MPEQKEILAQPRPLDAAPAALLEREVARIAGRLAELLAETLDGQRSELDHGLAFLRRAADCGAPRLADECGTAPWRRLGRRLGGSRAEEDALLLAGLPEHHEGFAALLRGLHPRGEPFATAGLAARLFAPEVGERRELRERLESGGLVRSGLLSLAGDAPFFDRSLRVADGLWSAFQGVTAWPLAMEVREVGGIVRGLESWLGSDDARRALPCIRQAADVTILLTAPTPSIGSERGAALVRSAGRRAAVIPFGKPSELRLALAFALVVDVVPIVLVDRDRASEPERPLDLDVLASHPGPIVVCAPPGVVQPTTARPLIAVSCTPLDTAARRRSWAAALPELADRADVLAATYRVEPALAAAVAADLSVLSANSGEPLRVSDVGAALRARGAVAGSAGVEVLTPRVTWNDLVLPPGALEQLHEACDRLRCAGRVIEEWGFLSNRPGARGVRMLFTGAPGTGKTLSAEVLASELGLDLYRVDLSRVVSKWIGETEKNLARVFDAAEAAHAVLFFDEADALFGKRTKVADAHDRYANLETAYLLQRLEQFEGLSVLATNLRQNIDTAFLRRLEFLVEFEAPDRQRRRDIWRCHVPAGAPLEDDVDFDELAALYPIVGGLIRNAALAAAFLAAAEGVAIGRAHFDRAVRREYHKAGLAFPGSPLRGDP